MPSNFNDKQRALKKKHLSNLIIPNWQEMNKIRLCYPPTPPHRFTLVDDMIFDQDGDICMRNK